MTTVTSMADIRRQRAIAELVDAAEKWVNADTEWMDYHGDSAKDAELHALANHLRERFILAAKDLVRFGGTR